MKVFISLILILSHLFSTVGFSMEIHECNGEKSYSFFGYQLSSHCECNHESPAHKKDCCKDKKTIIKADLKEKMSNKLVIAKSCVEIVDLKQIAAFSDNEINQKGASHSAFGAQSPPGHSPPLYLLYKTFLI